MTGKIQLIYNCKKYHEPILGFSKYKILISVFVFCSVERYFKEVDENMISGITIEAYFWSFAATVKLTLELEVYCFIIE